MIGKIVGFLALAVYQVSAQCCGPRQVQVQAQQIVNPYQVVNQFVPNVVTNLPNVVTNLPNVVTNLPNVVTNLPNVVPNYPQIVNLPSPVINTPCNQVVQVPSYANQVAQLPNYANQVVPIVPNAVFATSVVDNSVANSLANALQLLIVSDLIESTINAKDCAPIIEAVDIDSYPCSYPSVVDLCPDVPLTAQLTLGYNLPVAVNLDGCGCAGPCACSSKYYF